MSNKNVLENTEIVYGKWIEYVPDNIFRKTMRMLRKTLQLIKEIKRLLLLGLGILLLMSVVWFILFLGTASANGPTNLVMSTLHYKGTLIAGNNPNYYPKYADIIHLTGDLDYSQPLANATSCYQPIYTQYYGDEYSTNSGYKAIYNITGMSYVMRDDNPNWLNVRVLTCSGTNIITVDYNKLVSGIHQ